MKQLFFLPDKNDLTLTLDIQGVMVLGYAIELFAPDGNPPSLIPPVTGNNVDTIPDTLPLPTPLASNHRRFVLVTMKFQGLDPDNFPNFIIEANFSQQGSLIGKEAKTGKLTGKVQRATLLIQLISKP
ncbi:hypothetical protein DYBT9275_00554 [Dyadobacter sp. CECT 9275]|uniref:Uncharacterized protein n=1 Tax=Dyadobacter helix TaxID=2822344 RepID=A0A916J8L9_9BACT|nr:hypothetical protein [Dyadobacter sp. CECT 9275]CAG4990544.1 hypothetical protein DYBT9275_00554 [Dyadobacter sp. CECT 9275]